MSPPALFERLRAAVIARTGHFYYADKDEVLRERIARRTRALGVDFTQYAERLLRNEPEEEPEWLALEGELTIGETFFFRYAEQFEALSDAILPELIERRAETRRLRIWSAGCATGAEPYSLAILLHDLLGERIGDWRITLVGTDINAGFLEAARTGCFGAWALRALDPPRIRAWFTEEGPRRWRLKARYRRMVRFQRANLLDLLGPTPPLDLADFDLILCRNVLIYFHPETAAEVVAALGNALSPDGWLLLGHAEIQPGFSRLLRPRTLPGALAYQPLAEEGEAPPSQAARSPVPPVERPAPPAPPPKGRLSRPAATPERPSTSSPRALAPPAPAVVPARPDELEALLSEAQSASDRGDYAGAESLLARAIEARPVEPVLHYRRALAALADDRLKDAETSLRRAVYLDPGFVMAQYRLALAHGAMGRIGQARRALAAAARMAGTFPPDAHLREGLGVRAGAFKAFARLHLDEPGGSF